MTDTEEMEIGYRYVKSRDSNGELRDVEIPLRLIHFLHPREEDRFLFSDAHSQTVTNLGNAIDLAIAGRPGVTLASRYRVDWQVPGVRPHRPDLVAFENFPDVWDNRQMTLPVRDIGARPLVAIEVTDRPTRRVDFEQKFLQFYAVGVPVYVIVDIAGPPDTRRILGFDRGPDGFKPLHYDPDRGSFIRGINMWLRWEHHRVIATRLAGHDIPTVPELAAQVSELKRELAALKARLNDAE